MKQTTFLIFYIAAAFILTANLIFPPVAKAAGSHLDYSFSDDGKTLTDFGSSISPTNDIAKDICLYETKIIVVGSSGNAAAVARYNADGTLDATFSGDGKATFNLSSEDSGNACAVQSDGKIIVGGGSAGDFAILRINTDGSLDTTFQGGTVLVDFYGNTDEAQAVTISNDGKIIVAGDAFTGGEFNWALARLNSNGTLDTTFDGNGKVATDFYGIHDYVSDILIHANGKIVVSGIANTHSEFEDDFGIARYNTDGSLDTTFSEDGKANFNIRNTPSYDYATSLAVTETGRYILAGSANSYPNNDLAVIRLTASGFLDSSFGIGGKVISDFFANNSETATDVAVQSDGRIVVTYTAGSTSFTYKDFGLARYNADGALDPTFGTGGKLLTVFGTNVQTTGAVKYQPNGNRPGKIIAAGNYTISQGNSDFAVARYTLNSIASTGDYTDDGRADLGVFRPSDGNWYIYDTASGGYNISHWGLSGDIPAPGDYNGDGRQDQAVYRGGVWYILTGTNYTITQFGLPGDKPVPADYDGDGKTDIAVYRPSDGVWHLLRTTLGYTSFQFGLAEDTPTPGDYDGDGLADIAVFRPSNGVWYLQRSLFGFTASQFGTSGDRAVPADYDGDGRTDIAVWRPATGVWYAVRSYENSILITQFGSNGDVPSAADYDADGKADLTVFRPSNGAWYLLRSKNNGVVILGWGANGDIPVSSAIVQQ